MGKFYDSVPVSAIVRIRDMMYTVKDPFRLDQGDVSFDAPETFKQAVAKSMTENRTHYLPTAGIPPLRKAFAVQMPLREDLRFRWNIDDVEKAITPKTRVLYLNSPNNPSGGVLTKEDLERLAAIAKEKNLW